MNIMTHGAVTQPADITEIAENTSAACISTRIRQLSRIITRVYDDALRPLGITASQFTLLTQLAQQDGITAVEIGHALDIEKSTLSRNLKRLLQDGFLTMDPPAGRRGRGLHLTPKGEMVIHAGVSRLARSANADHQGSGPREPQHPRRASDAGGEAGGRLTFPLSRSPHYSHRRAPPPRAGLLLPGTRGRDVPCRPAERGR